MKKAFVILFLLIITDKAVFSQRRKPSTELGVFGGISFYRGDLNNFSNPFIFVKPAGGLFLRRNFNPRFSFRGNALYGQVEASDAETQSVLQQQRNLSFRSSIIEGSMQFEFNYLSFMVGAEKSYPATTYLFLGMGAFWFNPQANYNGDWVNLQPLGTEGQGTSLSTKEKYNRVQPSLPMGIGLKVALGDKGCLGFEWGMRKTFTDYIDDVSGSYVDPVLLAAEKGTAAADLSDRGNYIDPALPMIGRQRGNSKNKDWYSFLGITLSFKFKQKEEPCYSYP